MARPTQARAWNWSPSLAPPPSERPYVHKLANGRYVYSPPGAGVKANSVDEKRMAVAAVLTTPDVDRVGDIVRSEGCRLDQYATNDKWFFAHQTDPIPVGVAHYKDGPVEIYPSQDMVWGWCFFYEGRREGPQYFQLVKDGILTATSIAFDPASEPLPLRHKGGRSGWDYPDWYLLENTWCGIPCNFKAGRVDVVMREKGRLLRSYLSKGVIAGERISASVRKSLEPLAEPSKAWLAWDQPEKKMAEQKEGMAAASGTEGGYGVRPEEVTHHEVPGGQLDGVPPEHHETAKAVAHVMHAHKKDAPEGGPHDAYFHPEEGHVHHHHHPDATPEHLDNVKSDMALIDGVHDLTQHTEPPNEGSGHVKVFDGSGDALKPQEIHHPEHAEDVADGHKSLRWLFSEINGKVGKAAARRMSGPAVTAYLKAAKAEHKTVEECVHHKIPKLLAEGYGQDQAEAIAFSMCGEKKAFGPGEGDGEGDEDEHEAPTTPAKPEGPPLATLIADLVASLVALQEKVTAAQAPSPPEEEEEEEEEEDNGEEGLSESERTDAALARYRRSTVGAVRKMHPQHKADLMTALGAASDHMHKMAHLEPGAFGQRHKSECLMHARTLDRHHGMIAGIKEEPPPSEPDDLAPNQNAAEGGQDDLDEKSLKAINDKLNKLDKKLDGMEAPVRRINPSWLRG